MARVTLETKEAEPLRLSTLVKDLPGVGRKRASAFRRLGIVTVSDLLRHLPMRYEWLHAESAIAVMPADGIVMARGTLSATRWVGAPGRKGRFEAVLQEDRDHVRLVWFNAGYLRDKLHPGLTLRVQGKVKAFQGYREMVNPKWELLTEPDQTPREGDRLRPVYPASEDLPSAVIERLIRDTLPGVLPHIVDPLEPEMLKSHAMPALAEAYRLAHLPEDNEDAPAARRRLAFNELLLLQLGIALKRHYNRTKLIAPALRWSPAIDAHIRERFGFDLTDSQRQVIEEITRDLRRDQPMNRLVQGDVGAGKTVIALYAMLMAVADRKQGALMAPTELLAEQHFLSISRMLEGSNVRIALLTAGQATARSAQRRELLERIRQGEVDIVIGTQALANEAIEFNNLAVVVVDEQHRFGVLQRAAFRSRRGGEQADTGRIASPHYLVMTATPIPRTLSLTIFGDLDVSTIHGLPPGRTPITTRVVPQEKADEVYRYVAGRVDKGEQVYVVVPTIDETGNERTSQLKNVTAHAKLLEERFLHDRRVASLHGRMKGDTRAEIMTKFRDGQIDVLVATTVIEVGVDVPNATMMVVEHAERFGLAQLHQLRGRIGRGTKQTRNLCVFITDPVTEQAEQRMKAIAATTDGFRIAEADLEIRGMGDFFGTRQHGMPPLRVARIPDDMDLLRMAQRDAIAMIEEDPALAQAGRQALRKILLQQYGDALGLIDVG